MAYKDQYGITPIIDNIYNNLDISYDNDSNLKSERYPVLLFTPNMNDTNVHYHIKLDRTQAESLQKWLTDFLEGKETKT